MNATVAIDALVLHGFTAVRRDAVHSAFQHELARLWSERPPSVASGKEVARIDGGQLSLAADASSQELGRALARAVLRSLGGTP